MFHIYIQQHIWSKYLTVKGVGGWCDTFDKTHCQLFHTCFRTSSWEIWIPYPGSHTLATQPGTSFPLKLVEDHDHSPIHITVSACQWGANDRGSLWDGCRVGMPCDTPEWAAGGWLGGKDGSIHKGPLKDCRLGTRLALLLLPFHGVAGGGCCLVLTEWRDYLGRIGERRFIITELHFLHSVDGHYVQFCTYTNVLCHLPPRFVHTL